MKYAKMYQFHLWKNLEHEINKTNKSMMQVHTLTIVEYTLEVIRRGRLYLLNMFVKLVHKSYEKSHCSKNLCEQL
jgi:hypothetical protein